MKTRISNKTTADQQWVEKTLIEHWGAREIAIRGELIDAAGFPAMIFLRGVERRGLATYRIVGNAIELVTLNALDQGQGIGAQLMDAVCAEGRRAGCARAVLITNNDNLAALGFYQKRGWRLSGLSIGAVEAARRKKPSIPLVAENGIPIRDELELSFDLAG
jgi:ribosomal protein S18 acetylase RimI-like enzyme